MSHPASFAVTFVTSRPAYTSDAPRRVRLRDIRNFSAATCNPAPTGRTYLGAHGYRLHAVMTMNTLKAVAASREHAALAHSSNSSTGHTQERHMRSINIYLGHDGWFYEVWTAGRLVVLGCSRTRERAQIEAAIA
jgi:hypothetical protein